MTAPPGPEAGSEGAFGRRPSVGTAAAARAVAEDASALVRAEIELAKAELLIGVRAKATGAGLLAGAGVLAALAGLALLLALGFALAEVAGLPGWASALIVAGLLLLVAAILVLLGRKALATPIDLEPAKERLREDVEHAKRNLGRQP